MLIKFIDKAHKERFDNLLPRLTSYTRDREVTAYAYILSSPALFNKKDLYNKDGFLMYGVEDFPYIKEKVGFSLSSSEEILLRLALTLFKSDDMGAPIDELYRKLDNKNLIVAINAIKIRYAGLRDMPTDAELCICELPL